MERGDLADFVKKRITDHDFPPPLYVGGKLNKKNETIKADKAKKA